MTENRGFRFAIIGAGGIAGHFADAVKLMEGVEVAAVGSKSEERAKAFAEKNGIEKYYGNYEEMLLEVKPDAVYIATTPNFHYDNTMLCLERGIPVLCEKAAYRSEEEAARVIETAKEKGVFVMEALWTRFLPTLKTAKAWLEKGGIGDVVSFYSNVGGAFDRNAAKRNFDPALSGGCMYDLTCYSYDIADYFFGKETEIEEIKAVFDDTGVDLDVTLKLKYGNVTSVQENSMVRELQEDLCIVGTAGKIVIPHPHWGNDAYLYDAEGKEIEHFHADVENGFVFEIGETVACVKDGALESTVVPHELTLRAARLYDTIKATAK